MVFSLGDQGDYMLVSVLFLLALGETPEPQQLKTFQAEFRPLKKSERSYAKLGPAGPFYPQRASDAPRQWLWADQVPGCRRWRLDQVQAGQ